MKPLRAWRGRMSGVMPGVHQRRSDMEHEGPGKRGSVTSAHPFGYIVNADQANEPKRSRGQERFREPAAGRKTDADAGRRRHASGRDLEEGRRSKKARPAE